MGALPSPLPTVSIYTYDASDNRIEFQVPQDDLTFTYVVDDADNVVSITSQEGSDPAVLVETFSHDGDGNMTTRTDVLTGDVITYAWNDFNKLVKVSSADGSGPTNTAKIDQRYDGSGIRKRKLDKAGNSSAEFTSSISTLASKAAVISSSSPTISYIQGHQLLGAEVNGNFQYWLTDALGSVREVVDNSGTVIRSQEFDEHGKLLSSSGTGTFAPKTYQGALSIHDERNDSGLYLMGHRHYAPDLGRFISRDPIGFAGGLNLFNGAGASPVDLVDPDGLVPVYTDNPTGALPPGWQMTTDPSGVNAYSNYPYGPVAKLKYRYKTKSCQAQNSPAPARPASPPKFQPSTRANIGPQYFHIGHPLRDPGLQGTINRNIREARTQALKHGAGPTKVNRDWLYERLSSNWNYEEPYGRRFTMLNIGAVCGALGWEEEDVYKYDFWSVDDKRWVGQGMHYAEVGAW